MWQVYCNNMYCVSTNGFLLSLLFNDKKNSYYKKAIIQIPLLNSKMTRTWKYLVAGPTGCEKKQFWIRLIEHAKTTIEPAPKSMIRCRISRKHSRNELVGTLSNAEHILRVQSKLSRRSECAFFSVIQKPTWRDADHASHTTNVPCTI